MNLRPYQAETLAAVRAGWAAADSQLVVAPTGSGKTVLFAHIAAAEPGRTLILCHREELVDQAIDKIRAATGIPAAKEMAADRARLDARVVVASVQTMGRRHERWPSDHFDLVVCDEAHHAISEQWQTVLAHFDHHARVLGVTATPDRGDRKNLGTYFERLAAEIKFQDLVAQGFLASIRVQCAPIEIDLTQVGTTAGDYAARGLASALDPYLDEIAAAIRQHALLRRTLVFAPLIATAEAGAAACRAAGLAADHVYGEDPERAEKLRRFAAGEIDVLWNAMLLTEGYDCPEVDCVVVLRATKSRPLFAQMVGRGTRIAAGKLNCLLLDFLWLHEKHRLIRPAHLVAENDEVARAMTQRIIETPGGGAQDLEACHTDTRAEREATLAAELKAKAKRKSRVIDALEFALAIGDHDAADHESCMPWERQPTTERQAEALQKWGIDLESVRDRGHASKLLDGIMARAKLNLATPKQCRLLEQLKHPRPYDATRGEAERYLNQRIGRNRRK